MFELPDELWGLIKDFTLDWKRSHKQKMKESSIHSDEPLNKQMLFRFFSRKIITPKTLVEL